MSPGRPDAVVCPDKFRGSLDAAEAAAAMAAGLRRAGFVHVLELPLADGGEGTLDVLLRLRGGRRLAAAVQGPLGESVDAEWGLLSDGTAVVEMAQASGLRLAQGRNDPIRASTFGTGELIAAAVEAGAARIVVGVGGSATTDGGLGAVEALGWSLRGLHVVVACDVQTPFLDAPAVFGPQKGATPDQVVALRRRLEDLAGLYRERTGVDVTKLPGAGAAGGLAGGLAALGARLVSGFEVVADAACLADVIAPARLVLTGEGLVDSSTFAGKVVGRVVALAQRLGVPVAVIAGNCTTSADVPVETLVGRASSIGDAHARAYKLVEQAACELGAQALAAEES